MAEETRNNATLPKRTVKTSVSATGRKSGSGTPRRAASAAGTSARVNKSGVPAKRTGATRTVNGTRVRATQGVTVSTQRRKTTAGSTQKAAAAGRRRVRKRKPSLIKRIFGSFILTAALLCVIVGYAVSCNRQDSDYAHFKNMVSEVDHEYFFDGTVVDGIDVSGMTIEEARNYWDEKVEPEYRNRTVVLNNGTSYIAAELGYHSNIVEVLETAFGSGRVGTLEERYNSIKSLKEQGVSFEVEREYTTHKKVQEVVSRIAQYIDLEPVDSKVSYFDTEDLTFTFTKEASGQKLDREKLVSDIENALAAGGGEVALKIDPIEPTYTQAGNAESYGLIASAETDAHRSNDERLENVRLACNSISASGIGSGGVFSYNDTVGERSEERGFKMAAAYSSGSLIEEVGGGICQVSTTLMNAVVKSNLAVVERHAHSLPVAYVEPGLDAAVNWRSHDFRFRNTTNDTIYIHAYVTKKKMVVVEIYGRQIADGKSVVLESKPGDVIPFQKQRVLNEEIPVGKEKIVQEGKDGLYASAYKIVLDADGNQISRKHLFDSEYKAIDEITEFGPETEIPPIA